MREIARTAERYVGRATPQSAVRVSVWVGDAARARVVVQLGGETIARGARIQRASVGTPEQVAGRVLAITAATQRVVSSAGWTTLTAELRGLGETTRIRLRSADPDANFAIQIALRDP